MKNFKHWINEELRQNNDEELRNIWADTFKALGVGGLSDEDAAQQSLSKITFNQRGGAENTPFKGKQAVRKRLENGQIFSRLDQIPDPEIKKNVQNVRRWLDNKEDNANASTTISSLLQKMFGDAYFQKYIDSSFPKKSEIKPQVPKQKPVNNPAMEPGNQTTNSTSPPNLQPQMPPSTGMMGQQPPISPQSSQPSHPMPNKPAGAELGLF